MKHINEDAFADFVRGTLASSEHAAVEAHLAQCLECRNAVELWKDVFATCQAEPSFQPPEGVVRVVKAFAANVSRARKASVLELAFDSSATVATAGMRGTPAPRQLLYKCDELNIDLRVEQLPEKQRVAMVGQILHRATNQGVMGATISLLVNNTVVSETWSNQYGEFQLESPMGVGVVLSIGGSNGYKIELPKSLN